MEIWYYNRIHMLELVAECFALKCVILVPYMYSSITTSSCSIGIFCRMLLPTACKILFAGWTVICCNCYITDGVLFLLYLQLWIGRALLVHHDVCILFVFENVSHIMVENTSFGHFKCRSLWAMIEK